MISFSKFLIEKYKKYSHDGSGFGHKYNRANSFESWRGPHEGKEFEMMSKGVKPAALVTQDVYNKKFKHHVNSGKFISKKIDFENNYVAHIVGLPGEEYRVNKLHKEFSKPGRDHYKIGRLLGYTKEHIRKFTNG